MAPRPEAAFGVDVGGTKIAAGLVDSAGRILAEAEESTDQSGPDAPVAQVVSLLETVIRASGLEARRIGGVGVGVPGMPDVGNGGVWAPNVRGWDRYPLKQELQARLAALSVPVTASPQAVWVENDGRLATLGEYWRGAGQGAGTAALMVVGTGVGGGVVVDGKLLRGAHGVAGYFGWFVLPGRSGARKDLGDLESLAAGTALGELGQRAVEAGESPSIAAFAGSADKVTGHAVFAAAAAGDTVARQIVRDWAEHLAAGISNLVVAIDPDVIIIGGGLSSSFPHYERDLQEALSRIAHPFARHSIRVVPARLGSRAGLTGAAKLALDSLFEREMDHER